MNPLSITMQRDELLTILEVNREKHVSDYQQLSRAYQQAALRTLHEHLARISGDVTAGRHSTHVQVHLAPPTSFADQYDRAIGMIKHHLHSTIVLDERQYDRYVQDNWGWKQEFAALTTSYLA
ncbi:hypothetical protein [Deinococcus soli (ex Cha et al. 2016)]|uniref:Uncharacterized protein n=2 Tax=Deinococcus soli (ex Cha et al. 2016) TaxID=1309411 RepID=A0AAE3XCM5_9DEIO|nr:hypothetical protein [Deinococcus soli (ex Cha et al. 2016)]MDR6218199.1 hypothetical protein [Deinococcus soli (ex Cha et al. 2016)]MDR6328939.1 hypothetical protein [Deinococcus soli (ex Cha et al. 2016)]MDR6751212.1 hypothetical protein [Deinococcus soli (ex Cha et al. 2016)]